MMDETEVGRVLEALDAADVRAWVEGGWGIDALVGRRTRQHDDLDLAVDTGAGGFDAAVAALAPLGYLPTVDDLPVRLVVATADDRRVDLHPIRFRPDGDAIQQGHTREYRYPADGFTLGRIGGRDVPCLGGAVQRDFHSAYEPRPVDHHDLARLEAVADDPTGILVVSGIPGAGKSTVAAALAARCRAGVHLEGDTLQRSIRSGGRWAHEAPWTEAHRQLQVRTRAAGVLADTYRHDGFVPVHDDIYVSRERLDLLLAATTVRPLRLVVLAPTVDVVLGRDGARDTKTVGDRWVHLDAVQRTELAGIGLWVDSSHRTVAETVDMIWRALDDAVVAI
jgi:lincosamide nucleotidyltransferase A/C/D/E